MASARRLVVSAFFAWRIATGLESLFRCPIDWGEVHASKARRQGAYASDFFDLGEGRFLPAMFRESTRNFTAVETAIIVVHGKDRSSGWNLDGVAVGVNMVDDDAVAIVAPTFGDRPCTARDWTGNAKAASRCAPAWTTQGGWSRGHKSDFYRGCPKTISSYRAMDLVVDQLPQRYPRLSQIVLAGFSAGGAFVQKWSLLSPEGENGVTKRGVRLRLIAGAPSEYAYLDAFRPKPSCNRRDGLGLKHTCSKFVDVHDMHWTYDGMQMTNGTCNGKWDQWPYGFACLQNSTGYSRRCYQVGSYTIEGLRGNGSGANDMLSFRHRLLRRFASKDFRISTGMKDTFNCLEFKCSKKCPPMLQGSDRLQRGLNFVAHLNHVLAPYNYTAVFSSFPAGHDSDFFYRTPLFLSWVFGPDYRQRNGPFLVILLSSLAALLLLVGAALFWRRKRPDPGRVLVEQPYSVQMARIRGCGFAASRESPGATTRPATIRASREAFLDGLGSNAAPPTGEKPAPPEDVC